MAARAFTAVVYKEDDVYMAHCPEVRTISQGSTFEEAVANLKKATESYLKQSPLPRIGRLVVTTFEAECP